MSDPGEFSHRLVIEAPVEAADGAGGVVRSFSAVETVWASVAPLSMRSDVVAAVAGATLTHRIVIRSGPDLTTRHRLREGDRVFRIVRLRDRDGQGRFLEIHAEERRD